MTDSTKKEQSQQQQENNNNNDQQPWSSFYNEANDTFDEFASFDPKSSAQNQSGMGNPSASQEGGGGRTLSSRQISGMLEGDKAADDRWAEDWNDEDTEDVFDKIAEKCGLTNQQQQK